MLSPSPDTAQPHEGVLSPAGGAEHAGDGPAAQGSSSPNSEQLVQTFALV